MSSCKAKEEASAVTRAMVQRFDQQVVVVVCQICYPDRKPEFDVWVREILDAAGMMPGFLGGNVIV